MSIFTQHINVSDRCIGGSEPVFIIAEAGVNHNGDLSTAKRLIDVAAKAGADAVKFQMFKADNLILRAVEKAPYQTKTTDNGESQYQMLKRLEVSQSFNREIQQHCNDQGIIFITTPFDEESLRDVVELDVPAIKVASTDLTNIPFLRKIAATGLPVFLSTGMSFMSEVEAAVVEIGKVNKNLVLMQCTANYPITDEEANLAVLNRYRQCFDCILGYSDHSVGTGAAPFSVPMGVKVVEKHFTLNQAEQGPDHAASLTPTELCEFVELIRRVERYMGSDNKQPTLSETHTRRSLQKSLVAGRAIKSGELFSSDNLVAKRTGGSGISPMYYDQLLNKPAARDFAEDEVITL